MAQNDVNDDDWESTALRLVASRVDALPTPPVDAEIEADDSYGWEDTVIRRLRAWLSRGESGG